MDSSYVTALGRAPDAAGRSYWIDELRSRRRTAVQVGASIYGSAEHFARAGGTLPSWVTAVYRDLLGRTPSAADTSYWGAQAQARSRGWVALTIADAPESRARRVRSLYTLLLGRPAEPAGLAYWSERIAKDGDIALARSLAASPEYRARAVSRFG